MNVCTVIITDACDFDSHIESRSFLTCAELYDRPREPGILAYACHRPQQLMDRHLEEGGEEAYYGPTARLSVTPLLVDWSPATKGMVCG